MYAMSNLVSPRYMHKFHGARFSVGKFLTGEETYATPLIMSALQQTNEQTDRRISLLRKAPCSGRLKIRTTSGRRQTPARREIHDIEDWTGQRLTNHIKREISLKLRRFRKEQLSS